MTRTRRHLSIAAVLCLLPRVASSQARADTTGAGRHGRQALELWAGYAAGSADLGFLGRTTGRRLALVAGRLSRTIAGGDAVALDYTADVVPLALLWQPTTRTGPLPVPECVDRVCALVARRGALGTRAAYGAGVSPVGLSAIVRPRRAVQLRVGGSGGLLWFDHVVPTERATRFNFTATAEAGVQLVGRDGRGISVDYRFHHLSNAGLGVDNYGLASHVVSLGTRWRLGRR